MALASVLLQIKQGGKDGTDVRASLASLPGVSVEMETDRGELIVIVEADGFGGLHAACRRLEEVPGVLGVYPSYVTTADETGTPL